MTDNPVDDLTELADQLADEFAEYRQPNENAIRKQTFGYWQRSTEIVN